MSNLSFFLRPLTSNKSESIIWIYATWNSKRLRLSTEIQIKNNNWNVNKIKGNGHTLENKKLYDVEKRANDVITNAKLSSVILTPESLKRELLQIISPDRAIIKSGKKQYNLRIFIEEYIETNPENLKPKSIGSYKTFLKNQLNPFVKKYGKDLLEFDTVDSTWDELFIKFCAESKNAKNTVSKPFSSAS